MSSLRVLVIDGYRSDYDGRRKAKSFMRVVLQALRTVDTRAEFHMAMMGMEELQQFIYDPNANAHSQAQALRNFSSTDLTFVGGESDLPPWHPKAALLLAYLNQCVIAGSHVFGDEVATRMVWHLACVCGRQLQVVEALNMEIEDGSTTKATSFPKAYSGSTSVMVDETTGEAFQFGSGDQQDDYQMHGDNSPGRNRHMPVRVCNVGLRRRAAALGAARGGKEDRKRLQIVKARGTEQHWLIPKIASEEVGPETYDTFEHRAHRVFDLNAKQDPSRAGMDLIEPFHGMSINGFTGPVSKPGPRRPSAKVRGPDRSCHVLANSQHGPELVETGRILGVNWPLSKLEAPLPNLVIQSYVQHYVLEKPDVSAEEPGLGESQRRDLVYKRLDQAKPLLNRFPLHSFEFALALEGQQGAEFGGGCSDVVRQLYREGALPTPHLTADNAFISLKKKPKTKFAREDPFAPAHKPGATPQPQAKGGGGGGRGATRQTPSPRSGASLQTHTRESYMSRCPRAPPPTTPGSQGWQRPWTRQGTPRLTPTRRLGRPTSNSSMSRARSGCRSKRSG